MWISKLISYLFHSSSRLMPPNDLSSASCVSSVDTKDGKCVINLQLFGYDFDEEFIDGVIDKVHAGEAVVIERNDPSGFEENSVSLEVKQVDVNKEDIYIEMRAVAENAIFIDLHKHDFFGV